MLIQCVCGSLSSTHLFVIAVTDYVSAPHSWQQITLQTLNGHINFRLSKDILNFWHCAPETIYKDLPLILGLHGECSCSDDNRSTNVGLLFLPYVLHRMETLTKSSCFGENWSLSSGRLSILSRKGTSCSDGGGRDGTKWKSPVVIN